VVDPLYKEIRGRTARDPGKSPEEQGYDTPAASDARCFKQARRVREIYDQLRQGGIDNVVIWGDFNDTPDGGPLKPLLADGSDPTDVSEHPSFDDGGRPGTYGNGIKANKIDYILLSPGLKQAITATAARAASLALSGK